MKMRLADLLKVHPKLHRGPAGEPYSWGVSDDVLSFIDRHINEGSTTLETGAGVSTVLFAMKGAHHCCIVPDKEEVLRIQAFCREHNICTDKLTFEIERSEHILPRLEVEGLDLVLIDGAHGFPIPFIDWHYSAEKLKIGGMLIIDDTQIWTGHFLKKFLLAEPEWRLEADYPPRTVVFTKLKDGVCGKNEWAQPYIVQQTIDLLYPNHIDMLKPYAPPDLLLAKERSTIALFGKSQEKLTIVVNLLDLYEKFQVDGNTTMSKVEKGLLFDSKSPDPQILLPFSLCGRSKLIRIAIESACDTYLQLYFKTVDTPHYSEQNSIKRKLLPENNELIISIPDNNAIGQLRIDPGATPGEYLIKLLEITDAGI
jgi:hypothetical protein